MQGNFQLSELQAAVEHPPDKTGHHSEAARSTDEGSFQHNPRTSNLESNRPGPGEKAGMFGRTGIEAGSRLVPDLSSPTMTPNSLTEGFENLSMARQGKISVALTGDKDGTSEGLSMLVKVPDLNSFDVENLADEDIRLLVELKMRKLDDFNQQLERAQKKRGKLESLSAPQLAALVNFQRRFRAYIVKKNFFKSLRMNDFIEHKKALFKLKRCTEQFKRKHRELAFLENESLPDY